MPNAIGSKHNLLYHSYFDPWIAYVGADTLEAWSNAEILAHYPSTVECPYPTANVYNFIHTFNYPKERFIEDFNTVLGIEYDYPVDLLYGDDPAAVERYFAPGLHALRAERGNHAVHRQALISVPRQAVEHGALLFCMIPHFAFPEIEIEIQIQITTNSIPRPPGFVKIFCANSCYPQRSIV